MGCACSTKTDSKKHSSKHSSQKMELPVRNNQIQVNIDHSTKPKMQFQPALPPNKPPAQNTEKKNIEDPVNKKDIVVNSQKVVESVNTSLQEKNADAKKRANEHLDVLANPPAALLSDSQAESKSNSLVASKIVAAQSFPGQHGNDTKLIHNKENDMNIGEEHSISIQPQTIPTNMKKNNSKDISQTNKINTNSQSISFEKLMRSNNNFLMQELFYHINTEEDYMRYYENNNLCQGASTGRTEEGNQFKKNDDYVYSVEKDWQKIIRSNQDKLNSKYEEDTNPTVINDLYFEMYKSIIELKERDWYNELFNLYHDLPGGNGGNIQFLSLATNATKRGVLQLNEHFKFLIASVSQIFLNSNNEIGSDPFPHTQYKSKVGNYFSHPSSASIVSLTNLNYTDSSNISRIKSIQNGKSSDNSSQWSQSRKQRDEIINKYKDHGDFSAKGSNTSIKGGENSKILTGFPISLKKWFDGFIWKGVFFRVFDKSKANQLNEYLYLMNRIYFDLLNENTCLRLSKYISNKYSDMNFIMKMLPPMLAFVETSSWILTGSPVIFSDKRHEHLINELTSIDNPCIYENHPILSRVNFKSFAFYDKQKQESNSLNVSMSVDSKGIKGGVKKTFQLKAIFLDVFSLFPLISSPPSLLIIPKNETEKMSMQELAQPILTIENIQNLFRINNQISFENIAKNPCIELKGIDKLRESASVEHIINADLVSYGQTINIFIYLTGQKNNNNETAVNNKAKKLYQGIAFAKKDFFGIVLLLSFKQERPSYYNPALYIDKSMLIESSILLKEYTKLVCSAAFERVLKDIDSYDGILHSHGLLDILKREGLKKRSLWVLYSMANFDKNRYLIGSVLLCLALKKILSMNSDARIRTAIQEKSNLNDGFVETPYIQELIKMLNILIQPLPDDKNFQDQEFLNLIYCQLFTNLLRNASEFELIGETNEKNFNFLESLKLINEILLLPTRELIIFLDVARDILCINFNYDVTKKVRHDKFCAYVYPFFEPLSEKDFVTTKHRFGSVYSIREYCLYVLVRQISLQSDYCNSNFPIAMPGSFYLKNDEEDCQMYHDIYKSTPIWNENTIFKSIYNMPSQKIIGDWLLDIEPILSNINCYDCEQYFLLEAYILQTISIIFEDKDREIATPIINKMAQQIKEYSVCSPEIIATFHILGGLIKEPTSLVDCQRDYMVAVLILHKWLGDPRGRGGYGTPIELFVTWRLSIIARIQGKINDAEIIEEVFDATLLKCFPCIATEFYSIDEIYKNPFSKASLKQYNYLSHSIKNQQIIENNTKHNLNKNSFSNKSNNSESVHEKLISSINNMKTLSQSRINCFKNTMPEANSKFLHPFTLWNSHLVYTKMTETTGIYPILEDTLFKKNLMGWFLRYLPTFQPSLIRWQSAYVRPFYMGVEHFGSKPIIASPSSFSGISGHSRSNADQGKSFSNPSQRMKESGNCFDVNIVTILDSDASSFIKRNSRGVVYTWGQNNDGQLGCVFDGFEPDLYPNDYKKLRITHPRLIVPLKDTIVSSVACGYEHSLALTISGDIFAWGKNKSKQLGLGPNAPEIVPIPCHVDGISGATIIAAGNEHSMALTQSYKIYVWGQGEGGILGSGNEKSSDKPILVEALKNIQITKICAGGLHCLALSSSGALFSWGRGEGGQLGIPFATLDRGKNHNDYFLLKPRQIQVIKPDASIIELSAGDAHSIALLKTGKVFGWGHNEYGQLGIETGSEFGVNSSIEEPRLIDSMKHLFVKHIYAGATFSYFVTEGQIIYGCGTNSSGQLGLPFDISERFKPAAIDSLKNVKILLVAPGESHTIALGYHDHKSISMFSWGWNRHGQTGTGDSAAKVMPTKIHHLKETCTYNMNAGAFHSLCVLNEDKKEEHKKIGKFYSKIKLMEEFNTEFYTLNQ